LRPKEAFRSSRHTQESRMEPPAALLPRQGAEGAAQPIRSIHACYISIKKDHRRTGFGIVNNVLTKAFTAGTVARWNAAVAVVRGQPRQIKTLPDINKCGLRNITCMSDQKPEDSSQMDTRYQVLDSSS
jgi:hypothetical protein